MRCELKECRNHKYSVFPCCKDHLQQWSESLENKLTILFHPETEVIKSFIFVRLNIKEMFYIVVEINQSRLKFLICEEEAYLMADCLESQGSLKKANDIRVVIDDWKKCVAPS